LDRTERRHTTRPLRTAASAGLALVLAASFARAADSEPIPERLKEYVGRIVVLNFWAAWCKPCRKELPMLAELQRELGDRGVTFVGASTDTEEDRPAAEEMLRETSVGYPVWYGLSDEEMRPLGLGSSIPATAIFDRDGTRAFRLIGEIKKKRLVERLEWLLGPRDREPPKELLLPIGLSPKEYREEPQR